MKKIDQLAMAGSVHWHGHVLRREGGHVLRRAFGIEVEGQGKKMRLKRTWKEQSMMVGLHFADQCGLLPLIKLPPG